jgi:hypothetical protein
MRFTRRKEASKALDYKSLRRISLCSLEGRLGGLVSGPLCKGFRYAKVEGDVQKGLARPPCATGASEAEEVANSVGGPQKEERRGCSVRRISVYRHRRFRSANLPQWRRASFGSPGRFSVSLPAFEVLTLYCPTGQKTRSPTSRHTPSDFTDLQIENPLHALVSSSALPCMPPDGRPALRGSRADSNSRTSQAAVGRGGMQAHGRRKPAGHEIRGEALASGAAPSLPLHRVPLCPSLD